MLKKQDPEAPHHSWLVVDGSPRLELDRTGPDLPSKLPV